MQAYFPQLNFYHTPDCARNLLFIIELVKDLKSNALTLTEVTQDNRNAVRLSKALVYSQLISSQILLPFI